MKFDTVIIGGGLSGLTAGIELARAGRKTAIVSAGQSALHFSSGSMELLGYDAQGAPVEHPLEAVDALPDNHPYKLLGRERMEQLLARVEPLFSATGVKVSGTHERNHWRLTPVGEVKPAWLTIEDYLTLDTPDALPWKHVAVVNIEGFLDFFPRFLARGIERRHTTCHFASVTCDAIRHQRESTTEMRATNIARVVHGESVDQLAAALNAVVPEAEAILMPAVTGFDDFRASRRLRSLVKRPLYYMTTMGTSVPGVRSQIMMQKHFRQLGGAYMLGDTVVKGGYNADGTRLLNVETANFGSDRLEADHFIFAAGSFFSHGLNSTPTGVFEPVLGLDVEAPADRNLWFQKDIFKPQPYMRFGLATDRAMHAKKGGKVIDNIHVVGASLPGADALREGSGAGIALLTALDAADKILNRNINS